jgi:hypothetical protein
MRILMVSLIALSLVSAPAFAEGTGRGRAPGSTAPANQPPVKKRSNSLSFEDNVVEGMNKNPLDSLQQVGREDGKNHGRLYKKRTEFQNEIRQSVQEAGYSP